MMSIRQLTAFGAVLAAAGVLACAGPDEAQNTTADTEATTPAGAEAPAPAPSAAAANVELPEGVTQDMVAAGKQAFETTICYTCHGMDGSGTALAPNLRDGEWLNTDGTIEGIEQVIRTGVPTPKVSPAPMPPMGGAQLSEEQIKNLAAYVYAIGHGG